MTRGVLSSRGYTNGDNTGDTRMERDGKGRFVKGNKVGVGNKGGRPRRATEEKYLAAFRKAVSAKDWAEIIEAAVQQAKRGDKDARKFLAGYLQGLPTQYVVQDTDQDGAITITYVNDWRNPAALSAPGAEDGPG